MAVSYRPTHKFLGQNAISLEYELRKLSQKFDLVSDTDGDIRASAVGAKVLASQNSVDLAKLKNELDAVRLGLWS